MLIMAGNFYENLKTKENKITYNGTRALWAALAF